MWSDRGDTRWPCTAKGSRGRFGTFRSSLPASVFCVYSIHMQMTATGIVFVFSGLSAASSGANHSLHGMLAMLSAMRYAEHCCCCKLDSGALLGSFSASGLEQNTHVDLLLHPNKLRKKESQRTRNIDGSLLPQVSYFLTTLKSRY